jgi:hypothetical protein
MVSVAHRSELEAFHSRKITLERRSEGAQFVTDIALLHKPRLERRHQALARSTAPRHPKGRAPSDPGNELEKDYWPASRHT